MNLFRIGKYTINMNNVIYIADEEQMTVYFSAPIGDEQEPNMSSLVFTGDQAEALRWWLEHNSKDVVKEKTLSRAIANALGLSGGASPK